MNDLSALLQKKPRNDATQREEKTTKLWQGPHKDVAPNTPPSTKRGAERSDDLYDNMPFTD